MSEPPTRRPCGQEHNPLLPPMLDDPHTFFARARREEPVFFSETFQAWVVTRFEDVCAVARDTARFSSVGCLDSGPMPPEVLAELIRGFPPLPSLVDADPPLHTRVRGLATRALSLRRITAFEPRLRAIAHELIDDFAARGRVELVHDFAVPLPGRFIAELLGLPREDLPRFARWSDDWIGLLSQAHGKTIDELVAHARGFVEFQHYLAAAIASRQERPQDDALSDLVAGDGGPPLGMAEYVNLVMQIVFAGHETTAGLITTTALELARDPALFAAARDDPASREAVIEEALRMSSPVHAMFRTATEDVELAGVRIARGDRVQLAWISANRDEARFADPQRFDSQRSGAHIAFGHGIHHCIGAVLARLEGRIAVEALTRRLPGLRLAPDQTLSYLAGATVRRLRSLAVAWDLDGSR